MPPKFVRGCTASPEILKSKEMGVIIVGMVGSDAPLTLVLVDGAEFPASSPRRSTQKDFGNLYKSRITRNQTMVALPRKKGDVDVAMFARPTAKRWHSHIMMDVRKRPSARIGSVIEGHRRTSCVFGASSVVATDQGEPVRGSRHLVREPEATPPAFLGSRRTALGGQDRRESAEISGVGDIQERVRRGGAKGQVAGITDQIRSKLGQDVAHGRKEQYTRLRRELEDERAKPEPIDGEIL
ncbi:hypothetical protein H4582DRAFT_2058628 [Lactarius indigo]|nr:hypothetical protein H4582DRAFT_2058628 [Lactarius indigo]